MSFERDILTFAKKTGANIEQVVRATCLQVSASIIEGTPVESGRAKGNWQPTVGSPASGVLPDLDETGDATKAKVAAAVADAPGSVFFLVNNLPYIRRLEYDGWSSQAPQGMVRVAVQEFEQAIAKAVRDVT